MLLVDNPLVNNKIVTKEAKHNGYVWIGKSGTVDMLSLIHISEPTRPY